MNEELNLVEILKNVPVGTKFWSDVHGEVEFIKIQSFIGSEILCNSKRSKCSFSSYGELYAGFGQCILFPSKGKRDWSKFKVDLPESTKVMCSDDGIGWCLRYYASNKCVFMHGLKEGSVYEYINIVPVSEFNFEDIGSNINKSI